MTKLGCYQHYKDPNHLYRVHMVVRHSDTLEDMVVYEALYDNPKGKWWVRSRAVFEETVIYQGKQVKRFEYLRE